MDVGWAYDHTPRPGMESDAPASAGISDAPGGAQEAPPPLSAIAGGHILIPRGGNRAIAGDRRGRCHRSSQVIYWRNLGTNMTRNGRPATAALIDGG